MLHCLRTTVHIFSVLVWNVCIDQTSVARCMGETRRPETPRPLQTVPHASLSMLSSYNPHVIRYQLVTRIISTSLKHLSEAECCDDGLENLGVGEKKECC